MSKFKIGDRVRSTENHPLYHNLLKGDEGVVMANFTFSGGTAIAWDRNGACSNGACDIDDKYLEPARTTLDNLSVGDVVIDEDGDEYTIAAELCGIFFHIDENGHYDGGMTVKQMKDTDYVVKGAEPEEPETQEFTLAEAAEALHVPLANFRIKEAE